MTRRFLPFIAVLISTHLAWAEEAGEPDGGGALDLESVRAYGAALAEGHRLYANSQPEAALEAYQRALGVMANDSMATYYSACAQRAAGDLDGAIATFRQAIERGSDGDDATQARALWNIAMIEEGRRSFDAAREAWRAYITFAEAHQSATTYVVNARQRLDAITAIEELDAAYQGVRERIAARAAESAESAESSD